MEIRNLISFVRIVELNNFTKAAASLGYSQTAVTVQIRQLENELGVPLFDRLGKHIRLTEAGSAFYPHALSILRTVEEARASVTDPSSPSGNLRIGTTSSLAEEVLSWIAADYIARYPKVHLLVNVINEQKPLFEALRTGAVDLVYYMDEPVEFPFCTKCYERKEPVVFVTHQGNPIVGRERVTLSEVLEQPIVISERESRYIMYMREQIHEQDLDFQPSVTIGSVSGVIRILLSGHGVAFLPQFMVREELERGDLVMVSVIDVPDFAVFGQLFLCKGKWASPAIRSLVDYFNDNFSS